MLLVLLLFHSFLLYRSIYHVIEVSDLIPTRSRNKLNGFSSHPLIMDRIFVETLYIMRVNRIETNGGIFCIKPRNSNWTRFIAELICSMSLAQRIISSDIVELFQTRSLSRYLDCGNCVSMRQPFGLPNSQNRLLFWLFCFWNNLIEYSSESDFLSSKGV